MSEPAFKGTLLLLQSRTRKDPESYREEFLSQLDHFKASSSTVASQRNCSQQYISVLTYLCHVSHCFPQESQAVATIVVNLLSRSRGNTISTDLRKALVNALLMLRSKNIISTEVTFPILFTLLQEKDKQLRKQVLAHIVSDIRRINTGNFKGSSATNRAAQNYLFSVMDEDDPIQARCAEMVLIDLYRRRIWCDERTVEVMTKACFSKHTAIIRMALRFFLLQLPKLSSMNDESDDDEKDPGRSISKMKQKLKIVKKTSKRDRILRRNVREVKRKYNKEENEAEAIAKQHVDPIRLLRDPQQFVERLLAKLRKTSERFEVRILFLNVIARTVAEYDIVHLPLYSFLERYMEPSQLHSTQLLALSTMCIHKMVPPDAVEPLVKAIANHFITDRATPDAITVGLNSVREICKRQPLSMNADLLKDLVEYKNQRGDRGVVMAARALLQLYREVYPEILPPKLRGSSSGPTDMSAKPVYGYEKIYSDIPGLELLFQNDDKNSENGEGSQTSSDFSSDSGEWITDSDSEIDPDDVEGSFVAVSDDEDEEKEDEKKSEEEEEFTESEGAEESGSESENDEEEKTSDEDIDEDDCPQLIPIGSPPLTKKVRLEHQSSVGPETYPQNTVSFDNNQFSKGSTEWYESTANNEEQRCISPSAGDVSSNRPLSTTKILTDVDFEKIRLLQHELKGHQTLRGRKKDKNALEQKRKDLLLSISNSLSAKDLEHFTQRKRESDKEERLERAQELRKASSKFEIGKKKKSKLNSTHGEHSKRGKLFQMTKRSQRVATKLKSSISERASREKEMKKKDIKFRIKRGWKA